MKQDTNKLRDESPVDDLFARRLKQHSVTPDPAAWERLHTRLAAGDPAPRVVMFWQNPAVYRYVAAACITLLLLAGGWWLRPTDDALIGQSQPVKQPEMAKRLPKTVPIYDRQLPSMARQMQPVMAHNARSLPSQEPAGQAVANAKRPEIIPAPATAPTAGKPAGQLAPIDMKPLITSAVTTIKATEKPMTGRVLVVTIAEPDALIEARQAANWSDSAEKIIVLADGNNPTATDSSLSARRRGSRGAGATMASTDDQSLFNLAYRAIKNKVTTNKSLKQ